MSMLELSIFMVGKWRYCRKLFNIEQRSEPSIPYRSSIMFATMSVAAETATEFALCLYDCRHEAYAQRHPIAVSFCRLRHKTTGYSKRFHQDAVAQHWLRS